jgi:hypothetical protein
VGSCYFEYGTTASYGESVECGFVSGISAFPPSSAAAVPVFARIYGLRPSTTYHFRIVGVGEGGTADGADETLTTLAPWVFSEEGASGKAASTQGVSETGIAAGALRGLIAAQLTPRGRTARIAALLTSGSFRATFRAPESGTAVIDWEYLPAASKRAGKRPRPPVLVASGGLRFRAAGTAALKIRLTATGRRLLRDSGRVRLTATGVFTPVGGSSVRTSTTFELTR